MITNAEIISEIGGILGNLGVNRVAKADGVITTGNSAVGDFMNRKQVEHLVDLTVSQSGWLSTTSVLLRSQRAGEIPRQIINEVVTRGAEENEGAGDPKRPENDNVAYSCKKLQATWYLTMESIREARAAGTANYNEVVNMAFGKAMGNDLARLAMNGDTSLGATSALNRLLRRTDGWLKKIRASGNRSTTTRGSAYNGNTLWAAMKDAMPQEYKDDADLRFLIPSCLDESWTHDLATSSGGVGSALGDRAKIERIRFPIEGIPQLIVPQMPETEGFARLSGSAVAADSVTSPASNVRAVVDSLFGGYGASHAGRRVKITCIATGQSEVCVVEDTGSVLRITTVGTLGQSSVSTTASDYTLDLADITPALLVNPRNLFMVMCDQVRSYSKFEQEYERWRMDVFYEVAFGMYNESAIVLQDGIIRPYRTFGS